MTKKIFTFLLVAICCFSLFAAKTDNWKGFYFAADFTAGKDGFNFDKLSMSGKCQVNDAITLTPVLTYSSSNAPEDTGFSAVLNISKGLGEKIGGMFPWLDSLNDYRGINASLSFRNPEIGFRAVEFDVSAKFYNKELGLTSNFGFLFSLSGDPSRTDFHFNEVYESKDNLLAVTAAGKLHFIEKQFKFEDMILGADYQIFNNKITDTKSPISYEKLYAGASLNYSYNNSALENGLYAYANLANYNLSELVWISSDFKAGMHYVNNEFTFDVAKAAVSIDAMVNFMPNITLDDTGSINKGYVHVITGVDYINNAKTNKFLANILVGGHVSTNFRTFDGVSIDIKNLDNTKFISQNILGDF